MSRFKDKQPHKVVADAFEYKYIIAGRPKSGKTSLVYHIVNEKYDGDLSKLLLVAFERGYKALDGIHAEDMNDWEDFRSLVNDLIAEKDDIPYKILAFDTVDVMGKMATSYVLKKQGIKDSKKYTAINDLGYGKGYELLETEMGEQIARLERAGFSLIFITHDKDKQFETREGLKYDKTTLSLGGRVRDLVLNMVDFVVFVELGKELSKGKAVDKRYIYFRGDSGLEAGSRFTHVPNRIEYDPKLFIQTVEEAILAEYGGDAKAMETAKKEQAKKKDEKVKEYMEEEKNRPESEDAESGETAETLIEEITERIDGWKNSQKKALVTFCSTTFSIRDYRTMDDMEDLRAVLTFVKEKEQ